MEQERLEIEAQLNAERQAIEAQKAERACDGFRAGSEPDGCVVLEGTHFVAFRGKYKETEIHGNSRKRKSHTFRWAWRVHLKVRLLIS